jgi:hypothetical protein
VAPEPELLPPPQAAAVIATMTAGAMSADFLHNFTFESLLRPAMRGSTPDPAGGAARLGRQ